MKVAQPALHRLTVKRPTAARQQIIIIDNLPQPHAFLQKMMHYVSEQGYDIKVICRCGYHPLPVRQFNIMLHLSRSLLLPVLHHLSVAPRIKQKSRKEMHFYKRILHHTEIYMMIAHSLKRRYAAYVFYYFFASAFKPYINVTTLPSERMRIICRHSHALEYARAEARLCKTALHIHCLHILTAAHLFYTNYSHCPAHRKRTWRSLLHIKPVNAIGTHAYQSLTCRHVIQSLPFFRSRHDRESATCAYRHLQQFEKNPGHFHFADMNCGTFHNIFSTLVICGHLK